MLFPCFYNAPLSYYAMLLHDRNQEIVVEIFDHYTKQTYRNRCRILGANGIIDLVIPVVKIHGKKCLMKDIRIDYDTPWNKNHWKSIYSAYASAPFFEYMEDSFYPFYEKHYKYLADLNIDLINTSLELLNISAITNKSETYLNIPDSEDARECIHPKRIFLHSAYNYKPHPYHQVFSDRHGFVPDLSIIDLLFNEGPAAGSILMASLVAKSV